MANFTPISSSAEIGIPEAHLQLLQDEIDSSALSEFATTPLFTESVRRTVDDDFERPIYTQYGLLGGDVATSNLDDLHTGSADPRVFYNTAAPSSVFICGSQGSGKSHTLSVLLENSLMKSCANVLPRPLTGLLFHRDSFVSETAGSPCEAAYLSSNPQIQVRVLCAPSNTGNIRRIYSKLPNVRVEELRINQSDLNTSRMLGLMAFHSEKDRRMPLYLYVVNRILRDLRIEQQESGQAFNYGKFKAAISNEAMINGQMLPLQQRLETLESFMVQDQAPQYKLVSKGKGKGKEQKQELKKCKSNAKGNIWSPQFGHLTIVDLSCPCITAEIACSLFGICLSLFLEQTSEVGRIIALDEAHKFMNDSLECAALTDALLHTIRLQRHLGVRVIISTQEPTISTKLLDLCSVTIVHRFTSPEWLLALKQHLAGASQHARLNTNGPPETQNSNNEGVQPLVLKGDDYISALFSHIVSLRTGEALIFAPSAIIDVQMSECYEGENNEAVNRNDQLVPGSFLESDAMSYSWTGAAFGSENHPSASSAPNQCLSDDPEYFLEAPKKLGDGVLKLRIRNRVTADGGRSIMAA